jgi:hypothetical protein
MTERDECTLQSSEPKIPKQEIGGGNSIEPKRGFYKNEPIAKLYIKEIIFVLEIIIKSFNVLLDTAYNVSIRNKYLHQFTQLTLSGDTLTITDTYTIFALFIIKSRSNVR